VFECGEENIEIGLAKMVLMGTPLGILAAVGVVVEAVIVARVTQSKRTKLIDMIAQRSRKYWLEVCNNFNHE
jgi:hypothetical protein